MTKLHGVWPVIATPFTQDGAVDYDGIRSLIDGVSAGGCRGLVLFGFASEFYKLSDEERREMVEVSVDQCERNSVPLFVSITEQTTRGAVEWAKFATEAGADGLMVLPPFIRSPSDAAVLEHIASIGRAVSVPLMVQYAPGNTGSSIQPETFIDLSATVENVRYYKIESVPPGRYVSKLLSLAGDDVEVLNGKGGRQMIETFDRGAVGVIPGGAMVELYVDIYDAYVEGNRDRAIELHDELLPMLNHIGQGGEMFIYYEKRMLARRGFITSDHHREPTFEPDEHYDALFEQHYDRLCHHWS